jgi:hypothetical protein
MDWKVGSDLHLLRVLAMLACLSFPIVDQVAQGCRLSMHPSNHPRETLTPILQISKLRPQHGKSPAQGHTEKDGTQDLNMVLLS